MLKYRGPSGPNQSRNVKILGYVMIGLVVFYMEVISYSLYHLDWRDLPSRYVSPTTSKTSEPLKILLVADPQIIGEVNELPSLLGTLARWDSDRYLKKTYNVAKDYVKPSVVIFLGDLFDEGSIATDSEYHRYHRRFLNIFNLPRKSAPGSSDDDGTKYIFIPGDNDVGGEGGESVSFIRLNSFTQAFGDYKGNVSVKTGWKNDSNIQFIKYNMFLPEEYNPSEKELRRLTESDDSSGTIFRVLLTHDSLLSIYECWDYKRQRVDCCRWDDNLRKMNSCRITKVVRPSLILSAHSHTSAYFRQGKDDADAKIIGKYSTEIKTPLRFKIDQNTNTDVISNKVIHEVTVPTCSYRMGTLGMAYGYLSIFEDGEVHYTVLPLPSRFHQLFVYFLCIICILIPTRAKLAIARKKCGL